MMRVGVLRGGLELESEKAISPSQKIRVVSHAELAELIASNATCGHDEQTRESPPPLSDQGGSSGGEEDFLPRTPVGGPRLVVTSEKL
jgi:hypothetical protein